VNIPSASSADKAPLSGITVIDASSVIAGPLCAQLFASFGARVIKLELPGAGDAVRKMGQRGAEAALWTFLSQGKECVTCRLSDPRGAELLKRMVAKSDVLIESFRPGTMERWGIGPSELHAINPALDILRISGFGSTGPYSVRPGYGTLAEAMSGLAHMTGEPDGPPMLPGYPVADTVTGAYAAAAVLASLLGRARAARDAGDAGDARPTVIETSIFETLTYFMSPSLVEYQVSGSPPGRQGNHAFSSAPRDAARCKDGKWVAYSVQSGALMVKLASFLGLTSDVRFTDATACLANGMALGAQLNEWISQRTRTDVLDQLGNADIPVAPINDAADVLADVHLQARDDVFGLVDAKYGRVEMLAPAARLNGWHQKASSTGHAIGAHNAEVYGTWMGLSEDEIAAYAEAGVI
jgi:crotonobetainyl-CoA:carnitine CoA-transferase CaiB-like acyl-CoA transferase